MHNNKFNINRFVLICLYKWGKYKKKITFYGKTYYNINLMSTSMI
jgi:hypothetical protein